MKNIKKAIKNLSQSMKQRQQHLTISFEDFLEILIEHPERVIRNVFQVFNDMIQTYVGEGVDEYPDDPESINYVNYDCSRLFVEGSDNPFFADRLFANRFINHIEALRSGAQQNKIYIFEGPPGCGKSTFLNNLLAKFEEYANTENGIRYETVWRLNRLQLGRVTNQDNDYLEKILILKNKQQEHLIIPEQRNSPFFTDDYLEIPCPSHDNPILMIPKEYRRAFFDDIFKNGEFKWKLFTEKEYEWVFKDTPCTICTSLYEALLNRLKSPEKVFEMLYARPFLFRRRLGEGISVYNPGDKPLKQTVLRNEMLQKEINSILKDSNQVRYIFSRYAKTNNGIYTLMDIKSHNTERLIELHNIISDGFHKVEDIEENVNSLFFALMNPEDKTNIDGVQSFSDRVEYIYLPYVLDIKTEIAIYRNIFGKHIDERFLPRVLNNFARVIISSRLNTRSEALLEWIGDPHKYSLYCDENLQLLKMEIYTGYIPTWLSEEDRKRFTAKRRRNIIRESETEGRHGFSGRDSIKIFNEFYTSYAREDQLINMSVLYKYFTKVRKDLNKQIPPGFLDSLLRMYDYTILQEVKESLYYYNEQQITRDLVNYMFAVNFEIGSTEKCTYTGDKLEITEDFLMSIENRLLGNNIDAGTRFLFRKDTQREYTTRTLTQEIMVEGKKITETLLFQSLKERYIYNLKEKVLDPFLENENFRRAIKEYDEEGFKTYDKRIREDVKFLIKNLCKKYNYTKQGAKEVCIYVIDNDLAKKFNS